MSYILDALKRADAERERGSVPGLHARQVVSLASHAARGVRSRLWPATAGAVILCAVAGLWVWRSASTDTPVMATGPTVSAPVAPALQAQPAPVPHSLTAPDASPAAVATRAATSASVTITRATPAAAVVPGAAPVVAPAVATTIAASTASAPTPALVAEPAAGPAPRTAEAGPAVPLLGDLAEGIRRQIPKLNISGVVYSAIPGQRILIVNNQVVMQGTLAAPEVQLEEIRASSAVFSFRGTWFQVAH